MLAAAEFFKHPLACLTLVKYMTGNTGDYARKYIKDPVLLRFIDIECYCWSTVPADFTPMINAGMVFCDRHYGGRPLTKKATRPWLMLLQLADVQP